VVLFFDRKKKKSKKWVFDKQVSGICHFRQCEPPEEREFDERAVFDVVPLPMLPVSRALLLCRLRLAAD